MRKEILPLIACFAVVFVITGCATTEWRGDSNHSANLIMEDQYTLTGKKHLVLDYPPIDSSGNINVVVEIPAGTNDKWEVDKATGQLKWEIRNGKPRVVSYLGYPGNYGMIPRTLLPKELGGDGDPLDVIIIGSVLPRGSIVKARPIGILKLLDNGEQDDKIIAVLLNSQLDSISSINELKRNYKGIIEILQIWFSNYKGLGQMQLEGTGSVDEARKIIKAAINAYNEVPLSKKPARNN